MMMRKNQLMKIIQLKMLLLGQREKMQILEQRNLQINQLNNLNKKELFKKMLFRKVLRKGLKKEKRKDGQMRVMKMKSGMK